MIYLVYHNFTLVPRGRIFTFPVVMHHQSGFADMLPRKTTVHYPELTRHNWWT